MVLLYCLGMFGLCSLCSVLSRRSHWVKHESNVVRGDSLSRSRCVCILGFLQKLVWEKPAAGGSTASRYSTLISTLRIHGTPEMDGPAGAYAVLHS